VHYSNLKCRSDKLELDFLWTCNKLRAQNERKKIAKYVEDAEKLLGNTNRFFFQVPVDFVE